QVMYRVIQVADGQLDAQTEGTSAISGYPATQSMTQAVIQGAFTSEEGVDTEAAPSETHYTYFPAAGVADGAAATAATAATAVVTTQSSEALLGQPTPTG
ncbi:USF1 factor, partial [Chloropsis hardwickii]|nr:USF1 factor [Chloropsis hardwickii]